MFGRAGISDSTDGNFLVDSWHTESGLPDGNVTALAQTPDGYLWVGTFKGLARFDGVRFTIFDGLARFPRAKPEGK
jgi:ligand-binding sensor domain-containing protein